MFLLDAGQDFEAASEPVRAVLDRYGAELLSIKPWDERKLAYTIGGRKRGLYVLTYFGIDPSRLDEIEHDCQLDERILRALFLRKEDLSDEDVQADTPATASARKAEQDRRAREERQKAEAEKERQAKASAEAPAEKDQAESAKPAGEKPSPQADQAQDESSEADKPQNTDEGEKQASGEPQGEPQEDT
jgi:small subunit ribosomal protein S6